MSFSTYPTYRPTGVEWVGDVPEHWDVTALKRHVRIVGGSTPKSDETSYWDGDIPWITPADLSRASFRAIDSSLRTITPQGLASCGTTLVPAGTVILSTRAPIGSVAVAAREVCTNQGCKSLLPDASTSSSFLAYALSTATDELNSRGKGSTFRELSTDELASFPFAFPPIREQHIIERFLDLETAKIELLIQEQQQLIGLLSEKRQAVISHAVTKGLIPDVPLKDSGVEWLGGVPEHWEMMALSRLVDPSRRITYGIVQPGEPDPSGRFMVRGQDYSQGWASEDAIFRVSDAVEQPYKRARLRAGDVVVTIVGAGTGNTAVVPNRLDGANITQTTARVSPLIDRIDSAFLALTLGSWIGRTQVALFQKGAAQPGLNLEHLKAFTFPTPPLHEQQSIVADLTNRLAGFDDLHAATTHATRLLQERRSGLISAAVTGKIDVRGLVEQQAAAA